MVYFGTTAVASAGTNASGNLGIFEYDVPTGYTALINKRIKRHNMAYTTINKHTDYFNTKLYTGNGASNSSSYYWSGFSTRFSHGLKHRFIWFNCSNHHLFDSVRGGKWLNYYQVVLIQIADPDINQI